MEDLLTHEHRCLRRLCAGEDAWADFSALFASTITFEANALRSSGKLPPWYGTEDLAQDLAFRLVQGKWRIVERHLEHYPELSFKLMIRTILRCCAANTWRASRRAPDTVAYELLEGEPQVRQLSRPDWGRDPAERLYREGVLDWIFQQLAGKDYGGRNYDILFLRFIEELSVKDIAERLKMKPGQVQQRLHDLLGRRARATFGTLPLDESGVGNE